MAYKALMVGVLFSIGLFAVKSGVGITYVVAGQAKKRAKVAALLLFVLSYGLVFSAVAALLAVIDPVRHLTAIQSFIQSGMIVHVGMAVVLTAWGVLLLKRAGHCRKSKGWLLLALPCPVCITVIFFSAGFLCSCFPDTPKSAVLVLYLSFVLINLGTMGVIRLYRKQRTMPAESFLGGAMLLIALYFFISVNLVPWFADVDKIFRLALHQGGIPDVKTALPTALVFGLSTVAFIGGFLTRLILRSRAKISSTFSHPGFRPSSPDLPSTKFSK